jgi:uncharacterized protein (DUF1697 family)
MTTWIALSRGINVRGRHILPMNDLIALLERIGVSDVRAVPAEELIGASALRAA